MAIDVLESDERGNVVAKPVIGFLVTTIKGETVLAAIEYANSREEAGKIRDSAPEFRVEGRKIQFDLTPQQALRLAGALSEIAEHVLEELAKNK